MNLPVDAQRVLDFWFGSEPDDAIVAKQKAGLWWGGNPAMDDDIRARFGGVVDKMPAERPDWTGTPRGMLATIILMDQFPRNVYRGTPRAFGFDGLARDSCRQALAQAVDGRLRLIERVFVYLPLEHSESRADQDDSVKLFSGLVHEAAAEVKELFAGYLRYAERHREIIVRFGRFPHRNRILGRASTDEEVAFLQTPGSSF